MLLLLNEYIKNCVWPSQLFSLFVICYKIKVVLFSLCNLTFPCNSDVLCVVLIAHLILFSVCILHRSEHTIWNLCCCIPTFPWSAVTHGGPDFCHIFFRHRSVMANSLIFGMWITLVLFVNYILGALDWSLSINEIPTTRNIANPGLWDAAYEES